MRYFTQRPYDRLQSPRPSIARAGQQEWDRAAQAFHRYRRRLRASLNPGMRRLADAYFHDCTVAAISFEPGRMRISLIGHKNCFTSTRAVAGTHELAFDGVTASDATFAHVGSYWGYEELSRSRDGYELRVLLAYDSREFFVRFESAKITSIRHGARTR